MAIGFYASVAQAEFSKVEFTNPSIATSGLFEEGETVAEFTARMQKEIECATIKDKLKEYHNAQGAYGKDVVDSFGVIEKALRGWDGELYRYASSGFTYNGALGDYADVINDYKNDEVRRYNDLLNAFLVVFQEKLVDCLK